MKFLESEDFHVFRVLICTIVIVALYLIQMNNFSLVNLLAYTIFLWLYYCIVFVVADSFKSKNLSKKENNHS